MLLAYDIGNSTIASALFNGTALLAHTIIRFGGHESADELWSELSRLWIEKNIAQEQISTIGISSVVPATTSQITKLCLGKLKLAPFIVSSELPLGMKSHYLHPEQLGSDRICSAVAGFQRYGGPLIIVDFGTATTYGVIGENGDFLGGLIALGVRTTAEALHLRTAQLPSVELRLPERAINTTSAGAIQAGVMFGAVDALQGMIDRLRRELSFKARVIATGGLSQLMAQHTSIFDAVEPNLVLEGISIIADRIHHRRLSPDL